MLHFTYMGNLDVTKFCMWVPLPDVIICARFYLYRPNSFLGADPRKLAVPIDLKGDVYNSWSSAVITVDGKLYLMEGWRLYCCIHTGFTISALTGTLHRSTKTDKNAKRFHLVRF